MVSVEKIKIIGDHVHCSIPLDATMNDALHGLHTTKCGAIEDGLEVGAYIYHLDSANPHYYDVREHLVPLSINEIGHSDGGMWGILVTGGSYDIMFYLYGDDLELVVEVNPFTEVL